MAAVGDGAGADHSAHGGAADVAVVLLVEVEEALAVAVGVAHGLLIGGIGVGFETGEAVVDVVGEAALGELAIAGDVDACFDLAAHDLPDGVAEEGGELLGPFFSQGGLAGSPWPA